MRTLALACVLVGHFAQTPLAPAPLVWLAESLPLVAKYGVTIFFVLSGFLQTELLLGDEQRLGVISAGRFYAKRVLRLAPVFLLYVLFVIGWSGLTRYDVTAFEVASVLLCFKHVVGDAPLLSHFWSLSVEVLFYLVWPLLLARLPRRRRRAAALGLMVLLPATTPLLRLGWPDTDHTHLSQFFRAEAIFAGCWLSFVRREVTAGSRLLALAQRHADLLWLGALVLGFAALRFEPGSTLRYNETFGYVAQLISAIVLVHCGMECRTAVVHGLLNNPVCRCLALTSFGIYVWQHFFFLGNPNDWPNSWVPRSILFRCFWFPLNLALSLLAGAASYYLIEKPLHPWRERIAAAVVRPAPALAPAPSTPQG